MKKFKKLWALIAVAIIACGFCVPTRAMGVQDKMKVRFAISEQALKFLAERCDIVNGHLIKHGEDYSQINEWGQMSHWCEELQRVLDVNKISVEALKTIHHVLILAYYDAKSADKVAADAQPVCKDARGAAYNCMPNHSYNRCVIVHCYESEDMEQGGNVPFWKISVHPFIRFGMTKHISKSANVEDLHRTSRTPRELGRKLRVGAALEQFYEFKKQMNSMSLE